MEPATRVVAFENPPADLVERLRAVLPTQGSPAITAIRENGRSVFSCDPAELILRSRIADALSTVWPDWRASEQTEWRSEIRGASSNAR